MFQPAGFRKSTYSRYFHQVPNFAFILCSRLNCSTNWMLKVFYWRRENFKLVWLSQLTLTFPFCQPMKWMEASMTSCENAVFLPPKLNGQDRRLIQNLLFFSLDVFNTLPFSSAVRSFKFAMVSKITWIFRINRKSNNVSGDNLWKFMWEKRTSN